MNSRAKVRISVARVNGSCVQVKSKSSRLHKEKHSYINLNLKEIMSLVPGYIYFIRERDYLTNQITPYVKIGLTREQRPVSARLSDHKTANPREEYSQWDLAVPMVDKLEKYMHHYFAERRIHGEWFLMDPSEVMTLAVPVVLQMEVEQAATKPLLLNNDILKATLSNGTVRAPTSTETAMHQAYIAADEDYKMSNARFTIKNMELRTMIGTSDGIARKIIILQQKGQPPTLDQVGFLAALTSAQQALCQTPSQTSNGTPKITPGRSLVNLDPVLNTAKRAAVAAAPNSIPVSNKSNPELPITQALKDLHMEYLGTMRAVKIAEWEKERTGAELANMLGVDETITGIITWVRVAPTTVTKFNNKEAKKQFESIFNAHLTPNPDLIAVIIDDKHHYAYP